MLMARRPEVAQAINSTHQNPSYLSEFPLPDNLRASADINEAMDFIAGGQQTLIVLGVPVAAMRETIQQWIPRLAEITSHPLPVIWTCKGFEQKTGMMPHELIADLSLPQQLELGVLSGPSFAAEVVQGLPVALTIASSNKSLANLVTQVFHYQQTRIYRSNDVTGVEVGGALKNVMAVACGISDGLELGNNARAALITRGLAEITRLGTALGGEEITFSGLTGMGDLVLTATGNLSRNRQVGLALGQGQDLQSILSSGLTAEGVRCAQAAHERAVSLGVDMPITRAVCNVLAGQTPREAVTSLLLRDATSEF